MKYIYIIMLIMFTSCSMLPFFVEEAEKAIEFEEDAVKHEIELREIHHNDKEKTFKTKATV